MKITYKSILILTTLIIAISCVQEKMITPDPSFILSFQRDGQSSALAGTPFYIIPKGSGEFFTLFDGTKGHIYGEDGAKGVDFNKADSLSINYSTSGTYSLTLLTSSTGNFGKDFSNAVKTVDVIVVDQRNSFTVFNIGGTDGVFAPNNEIQFSVPDIVTDFNFPAIFGINSDNAKAFVNGVEQVSGVTVNDFSQPVTYTVKSGQGNERQYTVKFTTFPASAEKMITKFMLGKSPGGNSEIGVIDETTKTINITANYATNLTSVRLVLASSYGSTVNVNNALYSDRKNYNLVTTKSIKVVAQNNTEVTYTLNTVADNAVSSFTFAGLVPAPIGVIDAVNKTVTVEVLIGTDITKLVALWKGSIGKVTVTGVTQTNGVTVNDFSTTLSYVFYKGSVPGDRYKVIVKIK
jgi:hypothetical protein